MADNYLENKMAAFREGRTVVRRPSASLESLLNAVAGSGRVTPPQADHFVAPPVSDGSLPLHPRADMASGGETLPEPGPSKNAIMPAQIEAVVRATNILKEAESFRFETDEKEGVIRLLGATSPRRYLLEAGEVIMAMRLKAAELHLRCSVELRPESTTPANPLIATLKLYK